jgi:hypothetical protein
MQVGWALAALIMQARRIGAGEVDVLIASVRLKNQSGPGTCSNALLVLSQKELGIQTISGKEHGGICRHFVCLFIPAEHQAGHLHIRLP